MEDNETSLILKNVNDNQTENQNQDVLSPEDFAWADSCLIEDPEISETNMNSLKEALLDILDQHSEIFGTSSNYFDNSYDVTDPDNLTSVVEEGTSHTAETSIVGELEEETEESHDVLSIFKQQPFLPTYNDEMMNVQYSDNDDDDGFVLSEMVTEPLCDDIFKVWDLDIQVEEEDELDIQLKEALSSNAGTRVPKKKGLKLESVDSLVASIAELSIK